MIPTILLVSFIVFLFIRLIPGDIVDLLVQEVGVVSDVTRETIEHSLGIDVPIHIQFFRWLGDLVFHGSLGTSIWSGMPVIDEVVGRWPVTLELGLFSIVIASSSPSPSASSPQSGRTR
jgi:peptide/nickel transport system permease protein